MNARQRREAAAFLAAGGSVATYTLADRLRPVWARLRGRPVPALRPSRTVAGPVVDRCGRRRRSRRSARRGGGAVVAVSREFRWLARELRPGPVRRRPWPLALAGWLLRYLPEIAAALAGLWVWSGLSGLLGTWPAAVALAAVAGLLLWWPPVPAGAGRDGGLRGDPAPAADRAGRAAADHPGGPAAAGAVAGADAGRGAGVAVVPGRHLRRGHRGRDRPAPRGLLRPGRAGHPGPAVVRAGAARRDPPGPARPPAGRSASPLARPGRDGAASCVGGGSAGGRVGCRSGSPSTSASTRPARRCT